MPRVIVLSDEPLKLDEAEGTRVPLAGNLDDKVTR
jgi:hypothetical protein